MRALLPHLPRARHLLRAEQRRVLEILAAAGLHGCAGATLLGHGFRVGVLADLVGDGLATARRETMRVGERKITGARIMISDAGRRALDAEPVRRRSARRTPKSSSGISGTPT
jgi:hypothetical protein